MKKIFILVFIALFALSMETSYAEEKKPVIGVVLMHGKTGQPENFNSIDSAFKKAGFILIKPEMPWSKGRYIDKTYEDALTEVDQAIDKLRKQGANKIVVGGHSMGGNGALAYAAYRGRIDGLIMLAPGHNPNTNMLRAKFSADVAKAKQLIDGGKGNQNILCADYNEGRNFTREMKANVYYSFFNPDGMASMIKSTGLIKTGIPVLYVAGSIDPLTHSLGRDIYDKLPPHDLSLYTIVQANHFETPSAAVAEIISWLQLIAKQ